MSWDSPSVPRVCQGGSDQGIVQKPRGSHIRRQLFSLKGSEGGQLDKHRGAEKGVLLKLHGKLATVQISELWVHGAQSLVFSVWRGGPGLFNYTETLQQEKNPLWLTC